MIPPPTERLRFREMTDADLDHMADLLGDPDVMRHYPRPKTRDEALGWIRWNERNYAEHGYGLWIVESHTGEFIGDCGLTWQQVDGQQILEVGYHTARTMQGRGYASEAARACVDLATGTIGESRVVAIINPENTPSRRVAEKIGLRWEGDSRVRSLPVVIYGCGVRGAFPDQRRPPRG